MSEPVETIETHPYSTSDLIELADEQRTPATRRLIVDYTEKGLLDGPTRQTLGGNRGSAEGRWTPGQKDLLLSLLIQRARGISRHADLCNLPVAQWLDAEGQDDEVVPLRQVRRALATWARRYRTESKVVSRRAARGLVEQRGKPPVSRAVERWLAKVIEEITSGGAIDQHRVEAAAVKAFDSGTYARSWARTMTIRLETLHRLDDITDADFVQARAMLNDTVGRDAWEVLSAMPAGLARERRRDELVDEAVSTACVSLISALGWLEASRQQAPPSANEDRQL